MDTEIPVTTTNEVFKAAGESTHWKRLNIGMRTQVSSGGYTWTIDLPKGDNPQQARIVFREGYGGVEYFDIPATWTQTIGIVEAAMSATRLH